MLCIKNLGCREESRLPRLLAGRIKGQLKLNTVCPKPTAFSMFPYFFACECARVWGVKLNEEVIQLCSKVVAMRAFCVLSQHQPDTFCRIKSKMAEEKLLSQWWWCWIVKKQVVSNEVLPLFSGLQLLFSVCCSTLFIAWFLRVFVECIMVGCPASGVSLDYVPCLEWTQFNGETDHFYSDWLMLLWGNAEYIKPEVARTKESFLENLMA